MKSKSREQHLRTSDLIPRQFKPKEVKTNYSTPNKLSRHLAIYDLNNNRSFAK